MTITVTYSYNTMANIFEYHLNGGAKTHYFGADKLALLPRDIRQALEFERATALTDKGGDVDATVKLIREWESRGNRPQLCGVAEKKPKPSRLKHDPARDDLVPRLKLSDLKFD